MFMEVLIMTVRGRLFDEIGEACGEFWYREGQGKYHLRWCDLHYDGWELEGIRSWAHNLGLQVEEETA